MVTYVDGKKSRPQYRIMLYGDVNIIYQIISSQFSRKNLCPPHGWFMNDSRFITHTFYQRNFKTLNQIKTAEKIDINQLSFIA